MASIIKGLAIRPSYYDQKCYLTWDSLPAGGELQRSPNGVTNWTLVAHLNPNQSSYVDDTCFVRNKVMNFFYRIVDPFGNDSGIKSSYTLEDHRQNGVANFIINEELREMRSGSGIPIAVFSKNGHTEYCPECTDEETGQIINSQCAFCGGTGRVGGYNTPVKTYIRKINSTKIAAQNANNPAQNRLIKYMFRTINIPAFQEGDMFADIKTDNRYIINGMEKFDFIGVMPLIVHLEVELLNRDHPFYNIEIEGTNG